MDKYYTPSIEEFHVGFEYEQYEPVVRYDSKWKFKVKRKEFSPKIWRAVGANYNWEKDLEEGLIRVRYLDKEDIESLGFKHERGKWFILETVDHVYYLDAYIYTSPELHMYEILRHDAGFGSTHLFKGQIKNKSELKKLLKQLKIIE